MDRPTACSKVCETSTNQLDTSDEGNNSSVVDHPLRCPPTPPHEGTQRENKSPSNAFPLSPHELWEANNKQQQRGRRAPRSPDGLLQRKQIMEMGYTNKQAIEVNHLAPNGFVLVVVIIFLVYCHVSLILCSKGPATSDLC